MEALRPAAPSIGPRDVYSCPAAKQRVVWPPFGPSSEGHHDELTANLDPSGTRAVLETLRPAEDRDRDSDREHG